MKRIFQRSKSAGSADELRGRDDDMELNLRDNVGGFRREKQRNEEFEELEGKEQENRGQGYTVKDNIEGSGAVLKKPAEVKTSGEANDLYLSVSRLDERMEAIGELCSGLVKAMKDSEKNREVDGDELNRAVEKVVVKYLPKQEPVAPRHEGQNVHKAQDMGEDLENWDMMDWDDQQRNDDNGGVRKLVDFLGENTRGKEVSPPKFLLKSNTRGSLGRIRQMQHAFLSVPVFKDDGACTIREMLGDLNNTAKYINNFTDITESEFRIVLENKLSPGVKTSLTSYKCKTLEDMYANLLNLYSVEEHHWDAFSSLMIDTKKYATLKEFIDNTMRRLSLVHQSAEMKSAMFYHALKTFLPPRLAERLAEYVDLYEKANQRQTPPIPMLIGKVFAWRASIDEHLAKGKNSSKFNMAEIVKEVEKTHVTKENGCTICGYSNHTANNCVRNAICLACGLKGHTHHICRNPKREVCTRCFRGGHRSDKCKVKLTCRLCNSADHLTVKCPIYPGEEPVQGACQRCEEKMHIRLFHPLKKCKNFPPLAEN